MKAYVATIHILVDAENEDDAADKIYYLLPINRMNGIFDWSLLRNQAGDYVPPRPIEIPDDYDPENCDLDAMVAKIGDV